MEKNKKRVLFICTHNSARSQIAEGLINHFLKNKYIGFSAGTKPTNVNPLAIEVMKEIGIDISNYRSKSILEFKGEKFDYVVTVCDSAKENCPFFPGAKEYLHYSFEDPSSFEGSKEEKLNKFREVRDKIKEFIFKKFGGLDD
ncbi:MAG: arsenate reductase ArsC [Caldisericia bacterium]|nr:arsenate reductase ArsC [Caldisericia bacterium]